MATARSQTLWHPHSQYDVYESLRDVLPREKFDMLIALAEDNQRAVEDVVNNPAYTLNVHLTAPTTGQVSDRYYVPQTVYLVKVLISLSTAGSSSTVVDIKRNGSAISPAATITLASSAHTGSLDTRQKFDAVAGDYVTLTCTTAGTSAAGLVGILIFQPIA